MSEKKSLGLFEVIYILMLAGLLIISVIYMGKPRIGIINLGQAAQELGVTPLIESDVSQWRELASGDLKKANAEYAAVSKGIKEKFAKATTDAEKQELKQQMNNITKEYSTRVLQIKARVQKHQVALLQTFRNRINPYIVKVAHKHKLWIVLDSSSRLVYATKQTDITDEVVAASRDFFSKQDNLLDKELLEKNDTSTDEMQNEMQEDKPSAELPQD